MTPVLALHGFTGSPQSWDFLAERPLAPSLIGHVGCAAQPEIQSFEAEVDRLAGLIPGSDPVHVVGYSLGGRLALGLALRHAPRVRRVTLLSAHPGLASEGERAARRAADEAWCELLLGRGLSVFVDAWQAQPLWASQERLGQASRDAKRNERLSQSAVGLVQSLRSTGLGQMPSYRERLQGLTLPVAIVAGELDEKFTALARHMAERIPRSEIHIVPGAGHDLLLERPEFITEVIRRGNQP